MLYYVRENPSTPQHMYCRPVPDSHHGGECIDYMGVGEPVTLGETVGDRVVGDTWKLDEVAWTTCTVEVDILALV